MKKCDMCGDEVEETEIAIDDEMICACKGCVEYARWHVGFPLEDSEEKS